MNLSNILVETGLCQIEPKLQIVKSDDYIVKTKALCHGIAHDTENSLNYCVIKLIMVMLYI